MSKKQRDYQEAIWELLRSEIAYMEKLSVICEVFISALEEVQGDSILMDVSKDRLFGNLEQVFEAHRNFWSSYLEPVVKEASEKKQLTNSDLVCQGFMQVTSIIFIKKRFATN